LYSYNEGKRGSLIASTTTDEFGSFILTTNDLSKLILMCMTGGRFTESYSGTTISLKGTDELCAATNNTPGTDSIAAITYYSHVAYGLSKNLMTSKSATPIKTANETISAWVGFDVIKTLPEDVTEIVSDATLTEAYRAGYLNSAISVLASSISKLNNRPPENENTSLEIAYQAHSDIAHDRLLNGQAVSGLAQLETVNFTTKMYRHDNALNILVFANSLRNGTTITPIQLVDTATTYNENESVIFGGDAISPFSLDKPNINPTSVSIKNKSTLSGSKIITADIVDLAGLSDVSFKISNSNPNLQRGMGIISSDGNLTHPTVKLFTKRDFDDGLGYVITITATNILGSTLIYPITELVISNVGSKISSISPRDNFATPELVRGKFDLTAQVSDPVGIQSVSLSIDGGAKVFITPTTQLKLTNPVFKVDVSPLLDGVHIFTVSVVNLGNIQFNHDIKYNVDNTAPDTRFIGNLDAVTKANWNVGVHKITGFSSDLNGLTVTKMTFDGVVLKTLNNNLPNNNMIVDFTVTGSEVEGVKTLLLESTDLIGGTSKDTRAITLDFTAPLIGQSLLLFDRSGSQIIRSLINNWIGGQYFTISYYTNLTDTLSGVKSVYAYLDKSLLDSRVYTNYTKQTTVFFHVDPTQYAEGLHTLKIVVTDNNNNSKQVIFNPSLYFDNTNPTISIPIQPPYTYTKPAECRLKVTTNDTGGSGLERLDINGSRHSVNSGTYDFIMPSGQTPITINKMKSTITDNGGNRVSIYPNFRSSCVGTSCQCEIF